MHSLPLFYQDPQMRTTQTTVYSCEKHGDHWDIVLEETVFYPEGGGQPGDRGVIQDLAVIDTQRNATGAILHRCVAPLSGRVTITLDWSHRYHYMVAHTAQHLLSAQLAKRGFATVSVHLSQDSVFIDIDAAAFSEEDALFVQQNAQECIRNAKSVSTYRVSSFEELALRRPPAKKALAQLHQEGLRIVEIDDTDRVACAGVHVKHCAELGLVLFKASEKIKNSIRTEWIVGNTAITHSYQLQKIAQALKQQLSSTIEQLPQRIQLMQDALHSKESHIRTLLRSMAKAKVDANPTGLIVLSESELELIAEIIPILLKQSDTSAAHRAKSIRGIYCISTSSPDKQEPCVEWVLIHPPQSNAVQTLCKDSKLSGDPATLSKRPVLKGQCPLNLFQHFLN